MNRRQVSFLLAGAMVLGGVQGCSTARSRSGYLSTPRSAVAPPCASCGFPSPQPPRFNPTPAPVFPAPNPPPSVVAPPPSAEIQQNSYPPPLPSAPRPPAPTAGAPGVYLEAPEPTEPEPARPMPRDSQPPQEATRPYPPPVPRAPQPPQELTRPYPPQTPEPPKAAPFMPPAGDEGAASPAMPVDIPQFAVAKQDVASGQEPFADGVTWLKAHGYRTVLHIRAPGEDDSAAHRTFEQSGLRYLSLEVSARTLSKGIVDQFNRLVVDPNNLPLFVYDKDSSLAGALWYLHFRLVDKETDPKAREDAARLGFQQEAKGPHGTMWIAVQNYLSNMKP